MYLFYYKSLRTFCLLILIKFSVCNSLIGQNYPSFTATIYDSLSSGYYFLGPLPLGTGTPINSPTQMIIDHNANVVYYKTVGSAINIGDFKIQEANGLISYSTANKFRLMDSTFTIIDSVRCKAGIIPDDHDMQVLPNGHFLLIGYENVTMDLSSYNLFSGTSAPGSTTATVRFGVIQEQDANKNIVFEWHSKDYFTFSEMDTKWLSSPTFVDFTHFNAVELDQDGNLLVSSRHLNEITKINRTTGSVMWRLGGNANQFTFTNDSEMFKAQHDIRRIANGNITLFDNGEPGTPFHPATAKEYQLDETNLTATLVWSYVNNPSIYSTAMGNMQRHANGNTLINYGWYRGSNTLFTVVNPAGAKVFELSFPDSLRSYRSFFYPELPFGLIRPTITCTEISGQFYLDAGAGYSSYKWSNGATTQMIPVTTVGSFAVFVPMGTGGYISSENYVVSNSLSPCASTAIEESSKEIVSVFPNPIVDRINLKGINNIINYEIISSIGQTIWSGNEVENVDFKFLLPGVYILKLGSTKNLHFVKFIKQ